MRRIGAVVVEIMPVVDTLIDNKYIIPSGNVLTRSHFNGTNGHLSSKDNVS